MPLLCNRRLLPTTQKICIPHLLYRSKCSLNFVHLQNKCSLFRRQCWLDKSKKMFPNQHCRLNSNTKMSTVKFLANNYTQKYRKNQKHHKSTTNHQRQLKQNQMQLTD